MIRRGAGAGGFLLYRWAQAVWSNRAFAFLVTAAISARLIVSPTNQVSDIFDSLLLYVENVYHTSGWQYAQLAKDYQAGIHGVDGYMSSPPGSLYQYLILRFIFGFGQTYLVYLTALPALCGDVLIAYAFFRVVREYDSVELAQVASLLYLMSGAVFFTSALSNSPTVSQLDLSYWLCST